MTDQPTEKRAHGSVSLPVFNRENLQGQIDKFASTHMSLAKYNEYKNLLFMIILIFKYIYVLHICVYETVEIHNCCLRTNFTFFISIKNILKLFYC